MLIEREEPLIAHLKFNFREFAATLPHIAQNAFAQGISSAVAATKSVAANGILVQNAAKKSPLLMKITTGVLKNKAGVLRNTPALLIKGNYLCF